jgi:hypothetical protein
MYVLSKGVPVCYLVSLHFGLFHGQYEVNDQVLKSQKRIQRSSTYLSVLVYLNIL